MRGKPRGRPAPTSPYLGVERRADKFVASLRAGKFFYLGTWPTERQAAMAFDRAVLFLGLDRRLNFPRLSRRAPTAPELLRLEAGALRRVTRTKQSRVRRFSSDYFGVFRGSVGWSGYVRIDGVRVSVGTFPDAEDAALARDRVLIGLRDRTSPLNFPERKLAPATPAEMRRWARKKKNEKTQRRNPYLGVTLRDGGRSLWQASLRLKSGTRSVGSWTTAKKAAIARDRAVLYYRKPPWELNFPRRAACLSPASFRALQREAQADGAARPRFRGRS